jgi:putative addiction module CopG family antidote
MATISVPLSPQLESTLDSLVKSGVARTKSEVMRKALELLAEQEAVNAVLQAEREPTLRGDLKLLMKKIK